MANNFYAIRVDAKRLVVAEVDCHRAAALLDGGSQVFLGTAADLVRLAQHLRKDLVTFARSSPPANPSPSSAENQVAAHSRSSATKEQATRFAELPLPAGGLTHRPATAEAA